MQREGKIDRLPAAEAEDMQKGRHRKPLFALPVHRPFITVMLCLLNIAAYVILEAGGGSRDLLTLVNGGAKVDILFWQGQYWRVFTALFLHLGLSHLLFNLYCLLIFGTLVESWRGHGWLLGVYLTSGISGNLLSIIFSPSLSLGASGAILGVVGALIVIIAGKRRDIPVHLKIAVLAAFIPFLAFTTAIPFCFTGIDSTAHIGGFLWGVCFAFLGEYAVPAIRKKKRGVPDRIILAVSALILIGAFSVVAESLKPQSRSTLLNYLFMGRLYSENERWSDAISCYESALAIDSESEEALTMMGSAFIRSGDLRSGILTWERLIVLQPGNSSVRHGLSRIYLLLGDERYKKQKLYDAFSLYQKSLDLDPENGEIYQRLSLYYETIGEYGKSLSVLMKALSTYERDGGIAAKMKEMRKKTVRTESFAPSLRYMPGRPAGRESASLTARGEKYLYEDGKYDCALDSFHRAIRADRANPVPWCRAGSLYLALEMDDRAGDYFNESIRLDSRYWEPWAGLGDLALKKRELDKARELYLHALSLQPSYPEGHARLAALYLALNAPEKAEACIDKALSLERDNPGFYLQKADIAKVRKRDKHYFESLTAALALARSMGNEDLSDFVQKRLMRAELQK
jgi:membrane associated rhomboid family serine protease/tetratricopeptide (TPR) repeat protein